MVKLPNKINRNFAVQEQNDYTLHKKKLNSDVMVKIVYCPLSCLVNNKNIEECNYIWEYLDFDWYITESKKVFLSVTNNYK